MVFLFSITLCDAGDLKLRVTTSRANMSAGIIQVSPGKEGSWLDC